jgi:hypothetical protein
VDYGQPSARAEFDATESLVQVWPSAKVVALDLVLESQRYGMGVSAPGGSTSRGGDRTPGPWGAPVGAARGLVPVLASLGVQCAHRVGATEVLLGLSRLCNAAHLGLTGEGGPGVGPCEFLHAFNIMVECLPVPGHRVRVEAPLMDVPPAEVVKLAVRRRVPLERTWTCVQVGPRPCGRCDPCKERQLAFVGATTVDPLSEMKPSSV